VPLTPKPLSDLTAATVAAGADLMLLRQGGTDKNVTVTTLLAAAAGGGGGGGGGGVALGAKYSDSASELTLAPWSYSQTVDVVDPGGWWDADEEYIILPAGLYYINFIMRAYPDAPESHSLSAEMFLTDPEDFYEELRASRSSPTGEAMFLIQTTMLVPADTFVDLGFNPGTSGTGTMNYNLQITKYA